MGGHGCSDNLYCDYITPMFAPCKNGEVLLKGVVDFPACLMSALFLLILGGVECWISAWLPWKLKDLTTNIPKGAKKVLYMWFLFNMMMIPVSYIGLYTIKKFLPLPEPQLLRWLKLLTAATGGISLVSAYICNRRIGVKVNPKTTWKKSKSNTALRSNVESEESVEAAGEGGLQDNTDDGVDGGCCAPYRGRIVITHRKRKPTCKPKPRSRSRYRARSRSRKRPHRGKSSKRKRSTSTMQKQPLISQPSTNPFARSRPTVGPSPSPRVNFGPGVATSSSSRSLAPSVSKKPSIRLNFKTSELGSYLYNVGNLTRCFGGLGGSRLGSPTKRLPSTN